MKEVKLSLEDNENRIDVDPGPSGNDQAIDFGRVLAAGRRRRKLFVFWLAVFLALGVVYLVTTPKTYTAGTTILIDGPLTSDPSAFSNAGATANLTDSAIDSAQQVIRSQELALKVVQALNLDKDPRFTDPPVGLLPKVIFAIKQPVRDLLGQLRSSRPGATSAPATPPPAPTPAPDMAGATPREILAATALQGRLQVSRIGLSTAFWLGFTSNDPALSTDIVNAYARAYASDIVAANTRSAQAAGKWLEQRLGELRQQSQDAAAAVADFRAKHGLTSSNGQLVTENSVSTLNTDLAGAIADAASARAMVETYKSLASGDTSVQLQQPLQGAAPPAQGVTALRNSLAKARARLQEITREFGADHPQAQALRQQIAEQSQALAQQAKAAEQSAQDSYQMAQARVKALKSDLADAIATNTNASTAQVKLTTLQQRADVLAKLYEKVQTELLQVQQQSSLPISNVRVLSMATLPLPPSGPSTTRTVLICIILGLLAGFLHAVLRERRDVSLRTGEDITESTGQRFLGYLPALPALARAPKAMRKARAGGRGAAKDAPVPYALAQPSSPFAETLRHVRLAIDLTLYGRRSSVIGITSVLPGEGKSTVALNLAALAAANRGPLLLIDGDPRTSGLSRQVGLERRQGLDKAILGDLDWRNAVVRIPNTEIDILPCPASSVSSMTSELLAHPGFARILGEMRESYSTVIVDLAPLGPVSDATVALTQMDGAVLVAEWGKMPRRMLRQALSAWSVPIIGVLFNKVDLGALKSYVGDDSVEWHYGSYGSYLDHQP